MTTYHLSSDFLEKNDIDAVLSWDLTADQFQSIQEKCSGNKIPANWAKAQEWAADRSAFLYSEALACVKYEYSEKNPEYLASLTEEGVCFEYDERNQYCDYHVNDDVIAYETTRGTQFWIFREGGEQEGGETFHVTIPLDRKLGNHHKTIVLAIGGVSNADRDRWEKTYLLPEGTPPEVFETLWGEMKDVYDRILVPHGFPVMETYAEAEARWAESQERDRKWREGMQDRLAEDYEDAEFEDYEEED